MNRYLLLFLFLFSSMVAQELNEKELLIVKKLNAAIETKQNDLVTSILKTYKDFLCDPQNIIYFNKNPFVTAIEFNNKNAIKLLLDYGMVGEIPSGSYDGYYSLLYYSIMLNKTDIIKYLYENNLCNGDSSDELGTLYDWSAAFSANTNLDLIKQMVNMGYDVNQELYWHANGAQQEGVNTPLSESLDFGNNEIILYLLKQGANWNKVKFETMPQYNDETNTFTILKYTTTLYNYKNKIDDEIFSYVKKKYFVNYLIGEKINDQEILMIGKINKDGLRLRDKPNTTGRIIKELKSEKIVYLLLKGDSEIINGNEGDWWFIFDEKDSGWLFGYYLDIIW
jgi:ankyrin repeat protein